MDVELAAAPPTRPLLLVAVEAPAAALRVIVKDARGATHAVRLDATGAGRLELAAHVTSVEIVLLDGDAEIARTPAIPVA